MSRRRIGERHIRKLTHSSGSYHMTLPIELIRKLGWQDNQKLIVKKNGKRLVVEDWPSPNQRKKN